MAPHFLGRGKTGEREAGQQFLDSHPAPLSCIRRGAPRVGDAALPHAQGGSLRLSGACARGVELRWIVRGSQAEGGAETHPAGWQGCGNRGGKAGTPAARFPQPLSPDAVPLRWDGCAASLSGSFY